MPKSLSYFKRHLLKLISLGRSNISIPRLSRKQVGIISASLGFIILTTIIVSVPRFQADLVKPTTSKEKFEIENAARTSLVQAIGGLFLFITAFISWRNYQITQDKQSSERFSKAIEQLDSNRYTVCLGGIFSLERLAKDSPKDHWTVIEVLTSFVREKTLAIDGVDSLNSKDVSSIRAALNIIGRRNVNLDPENEFPDLSNINFSDMDLKGIVLNSVNLSYCSFSFADLQGVDLSHSFLYKANFRNANLKKANFSYTSIQGADFSNSNLYDANFDHTSSENGISDNKTRIIAIHVHSKRERHGRNILFDPTLFRDANLSFSSFRSAILRSSADFSRADLGNARFENANLANINFIEADLHSANFDDSDLSGADFTKAKLCDTQFKSTNLSQAIFVEASTEGPRVFYKTKGSNDLKTSPITFFYQSCLEKTDFSRANFINAEFVESDLGQAKLSNTILSTTD